MLLFILDTSTCLENWESDLEENTSMEVGTPSKNLSRQKENFSFHLINYPG